MSLLHLISEDRRGCPSPRDCQSSQQNINSNINNRSQTSHTTNRNRNQNTNGAQHQQEATARGGGQDNGPSKREGTHVSAADLAAWGDTPEDLHEDDIRLVFQNVNGITTYDHVHAEIQSNNIRLRGHLTGMCETNVNWRNYIFRDKWETKMSRGHTDMRFSHASCNQGYEAILQRGGVSMMCTSRLFSRLLEQGSDQEVGRWAWMRFKANDDFNLSILTAYQVSQKTLQGLGMETTYMQQWRKLKPMSDGNCNPKHQLWIDLHRQIQGFQEKGG